MQSDWRAVIQPQRLMLTLAVILGLALVVALLAPGPIQQLMDWASSGLDPYNRRP